MKWLETIFDRLRPLFTGKSKLRIFFTVFDTVEHVILYPRTRTEFAPHVRDPLDIKRYMGIVLVAMMPCIIPAVYFFGIKILLMIAVSYAAGAVVEIVFAIIRKGEIHEGFFVTGMIFPLVLPPTTPLWMVAVGVAFGVFFGKEVFGGTGKNIFNPALVGRVFLTIAFPAAMSSQYQIPADPLHIFQGLGLTHTATDAITAATPMSMAKLQNVITPVFDLLMGNTAGSLGEIFHLGIIIGGIFLIITKVSNWRIPLAYLGSVFLLGWLGNSIFPTKVAAPLFQLLGGGLLFGAMFMATDPVTSPITNMGKYLFGIFCGLITILIRSFSSYVEGVMFSILIMNAFTPLIDHIVLSVKYRKRRQVKV